MPPNGSWKQYLICRALLSTLARSSEPIMLTSSMTRRRTLANASRVQVTAWTPCTTRQTRQGIGVASCVADPRTSVRHSVSTRWSSLHPHDRHPSRQPTSGRVHSVRGMVGTKITLRLASDMPMRRIRWRFQATSWLLISTVSSTLTPSQRSRLLMSRWVFSVLISTIAR